MGPARVTKISEIVSAREKISALTRSEKFHPATKRPKPLRKASPKLGVRSENLAKKIFRDMCFAFHDEIDPNDGFM
jgi:hypothetical protein